MQHDAIGAVEMRAYQSDGNGRVEDDYLGVVTIGQPVDASGENRLRKQPRFATTHNRKILVGVEGFGALVRCGVNNHVLGRKPSPKLPEVTLDTTDFRGEVIGDEQVSNHEGTLGAG